MELPLLFQHFGISLGLGLIVGLQRESAASPLAGVRTFPLVTIFGTLCGIMAASFGGWLVVGGLFSLALLIVVGNAIRSMNSSADPGLTTEVAILLMFTVGAFIPMGYVEVAIAIGGGVAVLLQFKMQMHGIVKRLGDNDLKAIMQFVLISLVILPVLPNQAYGPFNVLNPYRIWLMVVLIVGISLGGYIVYKFMGQKTGTAVAGVLGGVISSTATAVSYARRSASTVSAAPMAAVVIAISSAVVFIRLLLEIAVVSPMFLPTAAPPILTMFGIVGIASIWMLLKIRSDDESMPPQDNPSELKPALIFGLIYAFVLFAVAAAMETFGDRGLYVVAGLSGLADMDAITLSTAQLVGEQRLDPSVAWRVVIIASMSNLVFKGLMVLVLGGRMLFVRVAPAYGVALAGGALILLLWPW